MTRMTILLLAALMLAIPSGADAVADSQHQHQKPDEPSAPPNAEAEPDEDPPVKVDEPHDTHQHVDEPPSPMEPGMSHAHQAAGDPVRAFFMQQASGTSVNPGTAEMPGTHLQVGTWDVMVHGEAFLNGVVQTGPRGEDELFSTNWLMAMGDRSLGSGRLALRGMFSLEPATVPDKYYPELFQTGELADGRPIVDGQHPHDFFMELAAEYAQELRPGLIGYVYGALHGDPALGPVAFPHRVSAMEIPQATLGHHLQDSTHIAGSVISAGLSSRFARIELSGFHGEEPDEERWDFDLGPIDSWAARVVLTPSQHWVAQISTGHLEDPEAHEPGDLQRTTASVLYHRATSFGEMAHGVIWGRNDPEEGEVTDAFTIESLVRIGERNHLTGRVEIVDRAGHDLFPDDDEGHHDELDDEIFSVRALTLGYVRDLRRTTRAVYGAGFNVTAYSFDEELEHAYGNDPMSYLLFIRVRSAGTMGMAGH